MKRDIKTNSQVRANKEKLVMENFASVMKKLDATFLIESDVNEISDEKKAEHAKDAENRSDFGDSVSNCCGAKFKQGDICSSCGEHASVDENNNSRPLIDSDHAPYDKNIGMRLLTQDEKQRVIDSVRQGEDKGLDFTQDSALRYISNGGRGQTMWTTVNYDKLHSLKVPEDAHVANVVGNMNYTDAYKKLEASKTRR